MRPVVACVTTKAASNSCLVVYAMWRQSRGAWMRPVNDYVTTMAVWTRKENAVTAGMHTHGHSLKAPTEVAYLRLLVPLGIYVTLSRGHAE